MRNAFFRRRAILLLTLIGSAFLAYPQNSLLDGYAVLAPDSGSSAPVAHSLFRVVNSAEVILSETSIPAMPGVRSGLIYVDETETRTAAAFVNPTAQSANVTLSLRNESGLEVARASLSIPQRNQLSAEVDDLFPVSVAGVRGSLGFLSSQPIAAAGFRRNLNGRGEAVYTAFPMIDPAIKEATTCLIPYFRSGDGHVSTVALLNTSDQRVRGRIRLSGDPSTDTSYDILPRGIQTITIQGSAPKTGFIEVAADAGTAAPSAIAFVQHKSAAGLISEITVPGVAPTGRARAFVESAGTVTSLSVANPNLEPADVTFTLLDGFGEVSSTATRTLPPQGFLIQTVEELLSREFSPFLGQIEIASSIPVSTIAIRETRNVLQDIILSSLPAADLTARTVEPLVLPKVVIGGAFSTRLIIVNPERELPVAGRVAFWQSTGEEMSIPVPEATLDWSRYELSARGARQIFPGSQATVGDVSLLDPISNSRTAEVTINEGLSVRPNLFVLDSTGMARDDFKIRLEVTNPDVAWADATGAILGRQAGFSTLAITVGEKFLSAVITVVNVSGGVAGYQPGGPIKTNSAGVLYWVSSQEHVILSTPDLRQPPAVWAGMPGMDGFQDGGLSKNSTRVGSGIELGSGPGSVLI